MNLKRVLAMVLSLVLVLSCVPAMDLIPEAQAAVAYTTIEAEDTDYAVWNRYTATEENEMYSGGVAVSNAPSGIYPYWDNADDSTEDLSANFLDKSNTPYVAYYVEAPADGTYSIKMTAQILPSSSQTKRFEDTGLYYGAFYVNGKSYPALYENSSDYYGNVKGKAVTTQATEVELVKGINTIICVGITEEQDYDTSDSNWANIDCLMVESSLTPVKAQQKLLYAGDAPYVGGYTTINAGGSIGSGNWGSYSTTTIADMNASNAASLRGFTYTVHAPENGYYDITVAFNSMIAGADANAIGLLVDGVAQAREFAFTGGANDAKGYIDVSVYLTEGDHVLTVTAPARRNADDSLSANVVWCDYVELILQGGLTQSTIQGHPNCQWWFAEAELTAEGYSVAHNYAGIENNDDSTRSFNSNFTGAASANRVLANGNMSLNPSLEELKTMRIDRLGQENISGVTVYVEAPEAGAYSFKARIRVKNTNNWDSAWKVSPESVFMVNGDFGATATFGGKNDWTYDTAEVTLQLQEGINEITLIPMTSDVWYSSNCWSNIDCIFVDTKAQVVPVPTTELTNVTPAQGAPYLYPTNNTTSVGDGQRRAIQTLKVHAGNAAENLHNIPSVSYTVTAPHSGYYNLTQYTSNYAVDSCYVLFVDGKQVDVRDYTASSKIQDLSCWLSEGTHTITTTIMLPKDADAAASFGYGWVDFYGLNMSSELTLADKQVMGVLYGMTVMEAETDGLNNPDRKFGATESRWHASGATTLSGATGSSLTTDQALQHVESRWQTYVEYIVEAPEAGDYKVIAGVQMGNISDDTTRYIILEVNGQTMKVDGFEHNAAAGIINTAIAAVPVTVSLNKGRNVIRVLGTTMTQNDAGTWMNHDYLAIDSRLTPLSNSSTVVEADDAAFTGNYIDANSASFWDQDGLGSSLQASFNCLELTEANFRNTSWYSFTVDAAADGYYAIKSRVWYTRVGTDADPVLGKTALMIDGTPYELNTWRLSGQNNSYAEAVIYLTKGTHDLVFTGPMADSNIGSWVDGDFIRLPAGLTLANTQRYPVEGLVDGSVYTLSGSKVSDVWSKTTVSALKSNFFGTVTVTSGGNTLADTDIVPNGAKVSYASGTTYTVETYDRGDANGDGKIDIRDLKIAQQFVLKIVDTVTQVVDILAPDGVDAADVNEYKEIIFGKMDSDLFYQPHTIGADEILAQCNPVGRLYNYRNAVFMESSASSFTLTGDFKGDVTMSVRFERGKANGATGYLYVEVDGVMQEFTFDHNTDQVLTIASDLPAGEHTIKVSKGTYNQYDVLYVYSVSFNGTLSETASAGKTIEFLGDSITVGYGLRDDGVTTAASAYYTYANVAADLLGADYYSVANSGWRFSKSIYTLTGEADNYIGRIYEMKTMNLDQGTYTNENPDVIVINLGTNDAIQFKSCTLEDNRSNSKFNTNIDTIVATTESAQAVYNTEVAELLALVRKNNPNAKILWVYGAMDGSYDMLDGDDKDELLQNAIAAYNATVDADKQVIYVDVTANTEGKYAHPNRAGHAVIGQEVAEAIADATGWELKSE